jgi:hypothetical protein
MALNAILDRPIEANNAGRKIPPATAEARLSGILPNLRFRLAEALGREPLFLTDSGELSTWDSLIEYRAKQLGVSARTLYRWLEKFETSGLAGLADQPRSDRGTFASLRGRGAAIAFITIQRFEGRDPFSIHRELAGIWTDFYSDGSRPPSYGTVRNFCKSLRSAERGNERAGDAAA